MNKIVSIVRFKTNDLATYGELKVVQNNKILFQCKTIERGWLDNESRISCIPEGSYNVVKTYSNRFKRNLYLVEDVPGRAGIRLHSSNFASQLNGCIALGMDFKDINNDNQMDVINSKTAHKLFDEVMNNMPFRLQIINNF
jgi:hypothetical protein